MRTLHVIVCSCTIACQPDHNLGKNATFHKMGMKCSHIAGLAFQKRSGFLNFDDFIGIFYILCEREKEKRGRFQQLKHSLCHKLHFVFKTLESELTSILAAEATPLLYTEASTVNNSS